MTYLMTIVRCAPISKDELRDNMYPARTVAREHFILKDAFTDIALEKISAMGPEAYDKLPRGPSPAAYRLLQAKFKGDVEMRRSRQHHN
jgi:hypothetical protein